MERFETEAPILLRVLLRRSAKADNVPRAAGAVTVGLFLVLLAFPIAGEWELALLDRLWAFRPLPADGWVNAALLLGVGGAALFFFIPFHPIASSVMAGLLAVGLGAAVCFIFLNLGVWPLVLPPLLLLGGLYGFSSFYGHLIVWRDRNRLYQIAIRDPLTGLYTIQYFQELFKQIFSRAQQMRQPFSVVMMDLDHFKKVNDRFGHPAGDMVLIGTARQIQSSIRLTRYPDERDVAARYGGEEFILLLAGSDLKQAQAVADRIRTAVEKAVYRWGMQTIPVTSSLGVSSLDFKKDSPAALIHRADQALYRAKMEGRNRVCMETNLKETKSVTLDS